MNFAIPELCFLLFARRSSRSASGDAHKRFPQHAAFSGDDDDNDDDRDDFNSCRIAHCICLSFTPFTPHRLFNTFHPIPSLTRPLQSLTRQSQSHYNHLSTKHHHLLNPTSTQHLLSPCPSSSQPATLHCPTACLSTKAAAYTSRACNTPPNHCHLHCVSHPLAPSTQTPNPQPQTLNPKA